MATALKLDMLSFDNIVDVSMFVCVSEIAINVSLLHIITLNTTLIVDRTIISVQCCDYVLNGGLSGLIHNGDH